MTISQRAALDNLLDALATCAKRLNDGAIADRVANLRLRLAGAADGDLAGLDALLRTAAA